MRTIFRHLLPYFIDKLAPSLNLLQKPEFARCFIGGFLNARLVIVTIAAHTRDKCHISFARAQKHIHTSTQEHTHLSQALILFLYSAPMHKAKLADADGTLYGSDADAWNKDERLSLENGATSG